MISAVPTNTSLTYSDSLPFSVEQQSAVLGWMLKDQEFSLKCSMILHRDLFVNNNLGVVFQGIKDFRKEYVQIPHPDNLIDYLNCQPNLGHIKAVVYDCLAYSIKYNLNYLKDRLSDWIKTSLFIKHMSEAKRFMNVNDNASMEQTVRNFLQKSTELSLQSESTYSFEHPLDDFKKRFEDEVKEGVTTGITEFDKILGGSLRKGEHTVILAPLNSGKTTACLNFLVHNIYKNKKCLLLTHEGSPLDIACKIRQRMLMKTSQEILTMVKSTDSVHLEQIKQCTVKLKENLVYVPVNKAGGLYIETVVDLVRLENEKLFSKTGYYFDIVCDDYPAKLTTKTNNFKEHRHSVKTCYDQFQQLALEFNHHALSPIQCNRQGYVQNRDRDDGEYLSAGEIAEALGVAQDASNIIGLNRSTKDMKKNRLFFNVIKSRGSQTDDILMCNTDFSRAISHDESLGSYLVPRSGTEKGTDLLQGILQDNK